MRIYQRPQIPSAKESKKGCSVELSDSWEDLLVCGTDISGSCQRVDGSPELNKCLLAYILDGKNRLFCVKNDQGKIVGRVILRLLFKEEHGGLDPVLYMERYYGDASYQQSVENAAKAISSRFNIALYKIGSAKKLHSLESSAPYEYSDGALGVTRGVFSHFAAPV